MKIYIGGREINPLVFQDKLSLEDNDANDGGYEYYYATEDYHEYDGNLYDYDEDHNVVRDDDGEEEKEEIEYEDGGNWVVLHGGRFDRVCGSRNKVFVFDFDG